MRAPSPATAPVGSSPTIAPTRLAADAHLQRGEEIGQRRRPAQLARRSAPRSRSRCASGRAASARGCASPSPCRPRPGRSDRYIEMIAFGSSPVTPTEFSTTMIIGAMARIGMVWLAITQGITLASVVRSCTIADRQQDPEPAQHEPASVADSVTRRGRSGCASRSAPPDRGSTARRHLVRRRQPRPLLAQVAAPAPRPARPVPPRLVEAQAAFSAPRRVPERDDPGDHRQHRQRRVPARSTR